MDATGKAPDQRIGEGTCRTRIMCWLSHSLIDRFLGSDIFLLIALLGLGVLNFGWVFYPVIGIIWGMISTVITIGIIIAGIITIAVRTLKERL